MTTKNEAVPTLPFIDEYDLANYAHNTEESGSPTLLSLYVMESLFNENGYEVWRYIIKVVIVHNQSSWSAYLKDSKGNYKTYAELSYAGTFIRSIGWYKSFRVIPHKDNVGAPRVDKRKEKNKTGKEPTLREIERLTQLDRDHIANLRLNAKADSSVRTIAVQTTSVQATSVQATNANRMFDKEQVEKLTKEQRDTLMIYVNEFKDDVRKDLIFEDVNQGPQVQIGYIRKPYLNTAPCDGLINAIHIDIETEKERAKSWPLTQLQGRAIVVPDKDTTKLEVLMTLEKEFDDTIKYWDKDRVLIENISVEVSKVSREDYYNSITALRKRKADRLKLQQIEDISDIA